MRSVAIIPAAGSAERFGGRKLLADVGGEPLIQRTIASLREAGVGEMTVVVGPESGLRLDAPDIRTTLNGDPSRGMFSSLQIGVEGIVADAVLVLPGDMPFVAASTIRLLLATYEAQLGIVSPRYRGKRGHPVILPPDVCAEIMAEDPTSTLHHVLARHHDARIDVDVEDRGVVHDVDRPEDLIVHA